jgi:hypothetical protein
MPTVIASHLPSVRIIVRLCTVVKQMSEFEFGFQMMIWPSLQGISPSVQAFQIGLS